MKTQSTYNTIPSINGAIVVEGVKHLDEILVVAVGQKSVVTAIDGLYSDMATDAYDMKLKDVSITIKPDGKYQFHSLSTGYLIVGANEFENAFYKVVVDEIKRINDMEGYFKECDEHSTVSMAHLLTTEFCGKDSAVEAIMNRL